MKKSSENQMLLQVDNKLGKVKFSNWRARRIIEEFDGLVECSFPGTAPELKTQWKNIAQQYSEVIRILRLKKNSPMPKLMTSKIKQIIFLFIG